MSKFFYESVPSQVGAPDEMITFDPGDGKLLVMDYADAACVNIPKRDAINLASKLLQWGTSS